MTDRVMQLLHADVEGVKNEMKPECGVDVVGTSPMRYARDSTHDLVKIVMQNSF
jgi:hypothetical protein